MNGKNLLSVFVFNLKLVAIICFLMIGQKTLADTASVDSVGAASALVNQVLSSSSGKSATVSSSDKKVNKGTESVKDISNTTDTKKVTNESTGLKTTKTTEVSAQPGVENAQPIMTDSILQDKTVVVSQPVVIQAANLSNLQNPKISGTLDPNLKIEKVEVRKESESQNNLLLEGRAEPGAQITVYIFSSDPIVITLKADDSGRWSYELTKNVADGQHEAYVAMGDSAGTIVSKSEPIAFVKTAQAATMIPVSQLTENQSPMEKSSSQYIAIAVVIMLVFLMMALALIGIITHKRNFDETVN